MKKKIAFRGFLALIIAAALCLFFSGTLKTMFMPNVQLVTIKSGKLMEHFELPCMLVYRDTENFAQSVSDTVIVTKCNVQQGDFVKAGDVLFSLQFAGAAEIEKQLISNYEDVLTRQADYERTYGNLHMQKGEQQYILAYEQMKNAIADESDALLKVEQLLSPDVELPEEGYPEHADKELMNAIDEWHVWSSYKTDAMAAFQKLKGNGIRDTVWDAYMEKKSLDREIEEARAALSDFYTERDALKSIVAPHDGYVASVNVQLGDSYSGISPLYALTSAMGEPVLEVNTKTTGVKLSNVVKTTIATEWGDFECQIRDEDFNRNGEKCTYLSVPQALLNKGISLRRIADSQITATLSTNTAASHALIPVSAIHGIGNGRYVYVVEEKKSPLGNTELLVREFPVKVLAESDGMAAVEESLKGSRLAYMEDRPLSNGVTVLGGSK